MHFSQKCAWVYIDPSGHFVFYDILCSSNFLGRTSPIHVVLEVLQVVRSKLLLVDIYHRKTHWKSFDGCLMREIRECNFLNFGKKQRKRKTKYRSFLKLKKLGHTNIWQQIDLLMSIVHECCLWPDHLKGRRQYFRKVLTSEVFFFYIDKENFTK